MREIERSRTMVRPTFDCLLRGTSGGATRTARPFRVKSDARFDALTSRFAECTKRRARVLEPFAHQPECVPHRVRHTAFGHHDGGRTTQTLIE